MSLHQDFGVVVPAHYEMIGTAPLFEELQIPTGTAVYCGFLGVLAACVVLIALGKGQDSSDEDDDQ